MRRETSELFRQEGSAENFSNPATIFHWPTVSRRNESMTGEPVRCKDLR